MAETDQYEYFKRLHERMDTKYKHGHERKWRLSTTTNPFIPTQLEEFGKKINEGVQNIELGSLQLPVFETIPTEHFHKIRSIAKVTGIGLSFHAPIDIDPAGLTDRDWSEENRIKSERQLAHVMNRLAEGLLPDTKNMSKEELKNVRQLPVVLHGGGTMSQHYDKTVKRYAGTVIENGRQKEKLVDFEEGLGIREMIVVNKETGEKRAVKHEEKFRLGSKEKETWDVYRKLDSLNHSSWDEERLRLFRVQHEIRERESEMEKRQAEIARLTQQMGQQQNEDAKRQARTEMGYHLSAIDNLNNQNHELKRHLVSQIDNIQDEFKKAPPQQITEEQKQIINALDQNYRILGMQQRRLQEQMVQQMQAVERQQISDEEKQKRMLDLQMGVQRAESQMYGQLTNLVAQMQAPQTWVPVKEFAIGQAAKTVSNALFEVYNKQKHRLDNSTLPFVAIENFFPNTPISTAGELKKTVEQARRELAERFIKENRMQKKEAEKIAESMIGATWDMGHIYGLKQAGFEGKELTKKLQEQTKAVTSVTKHVHITDNFGWHDSHLAAGMGSVPIQEVIAEFEKVGFAGTAVDEAGGFIKEFKTSSVPFAKEFFGSKVYGDMGSVNPYRVTPQTFVEFPQHHFNLYSSSFSSLPRELGGLVGGSKSRLSGTPNQ